MCVQPPPQPDFDDVLAGVDAAVPHDAEYLHWDKLRRGDRIGRGRHERRAGDAQIPRHRGDARRSRRDGLNSRQLALLSDALREPGRTYTYGGHAHVHGVTHETARADLSALAARGLLETRRNGRRYLFDGPPDLAERLVGG